LKLDVFLTEGRMTIEKILFNSHATEILIQDIEVINSRKRKKEKFEQIVESIRRLGLLKPILVNSNYLEDKGKYELLCGEGRVLACKRLGYNKIMAEVISCHRKTGHIVSLVENMARKKYTTIELARLIYNLHLKGANIEELSKITNRSKSFITQYLNLMKNGEERLIMAVEENKLPISIAAKIAGAPDGEVQDLLIEAIEQKVMNGNGVNKVRKLIEIRMADKKKYSDKNRGISAPKTLLSLNQLKKDFRNTIREQEEYLIKSKRLEGTVSLLRGFIETLLKDDRFMEFVMGEGIKTPNLGEVSTRSFKT
jgi:ParB family chromosome partitioning protein